MSSFFWTEPNSKNQAPNIRIVFFDFLRGIAVLGIYWINIVVFSEDANTYITSLTGLSVFDTNILSGDFSGDFIEGTMRGLFSILFGASAMVFLNEAKLEAQGLEIVDRYYRRTLLLVLFGIIHAYFLLWPYDVLYAYGILGMFLFPLRKISPRLLLLIGIILLAVGDIDIADRISTAHTLNIEETTSIESIIDETDREIALKTLTPPVQELDDTNQKYTEKDAVTQRSYFQLFQRNVDDVVEHQSTKLYNDYLFDIGGMMIIGMALFKLGILHGNASRQLYFSLMLICYLLGYIARDSTINSYIADSFNLAQGFDKSLLSYNLGRLLVTIGHIGFMGLILNCTMFRHITRLIISVGRMALSNYIMQTIISLLIFYVFSVSLMSFFNTVYIIYILLAVWIFQIIFSVTWLAYFKFGPLEWLWRSLIYGKMQPFK